MYFSSVFQGGVVGCVTRTEARVIAVSLTLCALTLTNSLSHLFPSKLILRVVNHVGPNTTTNRQKKHFDY